MTDYLGISITVGLLLFIVLIVWSKVQGDTIIEILSEIRDFVKGDT